MEFPRESYPLSWPAGRFRVSPARRRRGQFHVSFGRARDELIAELRRLGAGTIVISTDAPLRRDGLPYADGDPKDPGCAVYFYRNKRPYVIACDSYDRLYANTRAIGKTIEALRTIERHGSTEMMEQAFIGFATLPVHVTEQPWWDVLGLSPNATPAEVEAAHRRLASEHHPDRGGDHERMASINHARDVARDVATERLKDTGMG